MGRPRLIGRIIVFAVNFTLWCAGILLVVIGAIALADEELITKLLNLIDGVEYVTPLVDVTGLLEGVAIFMIVLGSLLFLLGGNGCHGIVGKSKKSICVYWILLIGAILVEVALIIFAAVYSGMNDDDIKADLKTNLDNNFESVLVNSANGLIAYRDETTETGAWQKLQFASQCCGAYNKTDFAPEIFTYTYLTNTYTSQVPLSCCKIISDDVDIPDSITQIDYQNCLKAVGPDSGSFSEDGCWTTIEDMRWQFNLISIIIASCLIAFEILGVIFASYLWKKLGDD